MLHTEPRNQTPNPIRPCPQCGTLVYGAAPFNVWRGEPHNCVGLNERDVRMESFRAAVPGAHSYVRVWHIPTGFTAECGEYPGFTMNRDEALRRLADRVSGG